MLSVIIPAYNEEAMLRRTAGRIGAILQDADIPHELLFVDDGSADQSWSIIRELAAANPAIRGVGFSRILARKRPSLPALPRQKANALWSLTATCNIPPGRLWRCTGSGSRDTRWLRA